MSPRPDTSVLRPSAGFLRLADTLEDAGFEAWGVGGEIRNAYWAALTGTACRRDEDWDVATNARPEEVRSLFRRTVPVGIEHGTVGVLGRDGRLYEVTTFRRDVETYGRHARVTFADTIDEDLGRRDFTVNAMAWRPRTDEVRDPYAGYEDLEAGVLRAVGEPEARFGEDYLRVLRGLRFAGRYDLEIEDRTRVALEDAVGGLPRLSAERIREELLKVLGDPVPSTALDLYAGVGALEHWYPELAGPARTSRGAWRRNLDAVDRVPRHRARVRVARLLIPVAEEPEERREAADTLLERLRFSNADRQAVARLVFHYLPFVGPLDSAAQIRSWLAEVGDARRDLFRLHVAAARAGRTLEAGRYLVATWRKVHETALEHPPLELSDLRLRGDDILALGVPPGPLVGLVLDELLAQVLEDPEANERETLLAEARRLVEIGALSDAGGTAPPAGA